MIGMRPLALTDRLAQPQGQTSVSLAQRAYQIRDVSAERAAAEKKMAARVAVRVTAAQSPAAQSPAAQSPAAGPSPAGHQQPAASGSPQQIAEEMLGSFGWSSGQFSCLDPLWSHESGWSVSAYNPGTGAYGIPQAMPGDKMASAGADWQTDAATQIRWGLEYIKDTYGSPCGAWDHEEATGWY
jgi:hypothetical protein